MYVLNREMLFLSDKEIAIMAIYKKSIILMGSCNLITPYKMVIVWLLTSI